MTEQYLEELIQKYAEGTATEDDIQKLRNWYQFASIGEVQWQTTNPDEQQHVHDRMLRRLKKEIVPQKARILHFPWAKIAAILLVFIGLTWLVLRLTDPFSQSYITVTNPSGKIQLVRLPDSSRVWLNASSTLSYISSFKKKRALKLNGEAFFEVTHDAKHPFIVDAGGIQTEVLGTSFNVKAYGSANTTDISVITGKVKVSSHAQDLAVLTPSMQLKFNRQEQTAKTTIIDTNAVLSWKNGLLQFEGQTLAEIAGTLEKWYGVSITFANPGLRNCRYYMGFENTISLDKLLATMSELTGMRYAFSNDRKTITLSGKECH